MFTMNKLTAVSIIEVNKTISESLRKAIKTRSHITQHLNIIDKKSGKQIIEILSI